MKVRLNVVKHRLVAFIVSSLFIVAGLVAFFIRGGFNTGIDFGSGYSEKIQIAPVGLTVAYQGDDNVQLSVEGGVLTLQMRSSDGVDTLTLPASQ